jgi:hypothetical protein
MAQMSWADVRTLEDLGEMTARWLEGVEPYHPSCGDGGPDDETAVLVPDLTALNRAGFVTEFSQPAEPLVDGYTQRAAVSGFCREDVARRVAALGLATDLIVIAFPPGTEGGHYIPITITDYRPYTWAGRYGSGELAHLAEACAEEIVDELRRVWRIDVLDPQWGRDRYLWDHLSAAVIRKIPSAFDTRPANDDLSVDFVW